MIRFNDFIEFLREKRESEGVYVSARPDDRSSTDLLELQVILAAADVLPPLSRDQVVPTSEMHATVAYSRVHFDASISTPVGLIDYVAVPKKLTVFKQRDGDCCVVLELSCPELETLHEKYRADGASYDYPSYRPHVTLFKKLKSEPKDLDGVELPKKISFLRIVVEPLDTER